MTPNSSDQTTVAAAAWTSADVKAKLRGRHPAAMQGAMVGQWVCLDEWEEIDLVALNAWADADVIGYEVKVSRSDYRQELLAPAKRAKAVERCTEFYFAVPAGLLKPEEIAYDEPEWGAEDFERARCPGIPPFGPPERYAARRHRPQNLLDAPPGRYGGECRGHGWTGSHKSGKHREKGPFTVPLPVPWAPGDELPSYVTEVYDFEVKKHGSAEAARHARLLDHAAESLARAERSVKCPACKGKGYLDKSRVELEAPTLWVPRDVGLVEVSDRGCRVVKKSPKRRDAPGLVPVERHPSQPMRRARQRVHQLVRWASNRPDPRHRPAERFESTEVAA